MPTVRRAASALHRALFLAIALMLGIAAVSSPGAVAEPSGLQAADRLAEHRGGAVCPGCEVAFCAIGQASCAPAVLESGALAAAADAPAAYAWLRARSPAGLGFEAVAPPPKRDRS